MKNQMLHTPEGVRDIYNLEYGKKTVLEEKLQKILTTKESIRQAIINKGVNVRSDDAFSLYASSKSTIYSSMNS